MALRFKRGRDAIKRALDRRYITRDEGVGLDLSAMAAKIRALESEVASLRSFASTLNDGVDRVGADAQEAQRLAAECAQAIERLLQEELLLKRSLDAVAND